jgi:hypothetical protein
MIEVPSSVDTNTLADWAEASCLFGTRASVSEYEVEDALDNSGVPDPDVAVSNIWQEIDLRYYTADAAYPLRSLSGRIQRTQEWNQNPGYAFQLLLACQSHYRVARTPRTYWRTTAKLFEQVSTLALYQYLGGKAINSGVPREAPVPAGFGDCLAYLCQNLRETRSTTKLYTSKTKDDGVDVVAWRPFGDGRPGQVIILVQCAAGADWRSKTREISIALWREHIDWVTDPLKAFAFPFACTDEVLWRRLSKETEGLLLDRLRIAAMFAAAGASFSMIQTQLKEWCQQQLESLPWLSR